MSATAFRQAPEANSLPPTLAEFRTALEEEVEAARRAASSAAIELISGRRVSGRGASFQYAFLVESPLNLPDDSPADLLIAGHPGAIEATVVSVEGLSVTLSVPVDLGEFVARARLQSDLTHLLRTLIGRVEDLAGTENPAGERLLGQTAPRGDTVTEEAFSPKGSEVPTPEQRAAIASGLGRDITFIWGPPGTGKTLTIGELTSQLHARNRSVLLVSHTNAAVDQALLKVADRTTPEELAAGRVLRLGEPKDQRVSGRPELLVQTHVERRSAALLEEREALAVEQDAVVDKISTLDRLIEIAEWLGDADGELELWQQQLSEHEHLQERATTADGRVQSAEQDGERWFALAPEAELAIARVKRVAALTAELQQASEVRIAAASTLRSRLDELASASALATRAQEHGPQVLIARQRVDALREELPRREPLLAETDREIQHLAQAVASAQALLDRSASSNAITRRLRGLPHPDQQRAELATLQSRLDRLAAARSATAEGLARLQQEFVEAQQIIEEFGDLPDPDEQDALVQSLNEQVRIANDTVNQAAAALDAAEREVAELGDPTEAFRSAHAIEADVVLDEVRRRLPEITALRDEAQRLRGEASDLARRLGSELGDRLLKLQALQLIGETARDSLESGLGQVRSAATKARGLLQGQEVTALVSEREALQNHLREVRQRLAEIEEALTHVEELVIAEASVLATTLTRAYLRDSIQARQFDTVILDEASMAPIPALWVVAARAEANVVAVGDFHQLPPIKHSDHELAEKWLGQDIFRVAGVDDLFEGPSLPEHCVALREQRRMHPAISAIANEFFYNGRLRDGPRVADDDPSMATWLRDEPPFDVPVLLVDTSGLNAWVTSVNHAGRTSRLNFLSATVCADLAEILLKPERGSIAVGGDPRILLEAPYRPHARLLSLLVKEQRLESEVVAGTAHTFQGAEAPVVILDLVNDEPHWRVGMFDARRDLDTGKLLNVALTRAKRRLIVVGDFAYIERQARKDSLLRRLLAFLKARHPVVDASSVVPAGLAGRASESLRNNSASREEAVPPQVVLTQERFYGHLYDDLARANQRVVIYSPFATADRIGQLEPHLRAALERGVQIWVVTKSLQERDRSRAPYEAIEQALKSWGVRIVHKRNMHEKLVFIDDSVLWQGSLNPLSFSSTQEIMERRESRDIVRDYVRVLRLDDIIEPHVRGETACPYCGSEVIASEGRGDPFYWRCVVDDCYTRSIGEPMPVDGRVVCRTCGGNA